MKKKMRLLLLCFLAVAMFASTAEASTKTKAYKAYTKWIKNGAKTVNEYGNETKYNRFCLKDLDNDGVKELISKVVVNGGIDIYYIQSYKKGKIKTLTIAEGVGGVGGFRGEAYYIPKKGLIYTTSWGSANPTTYDTVYKLTKTKFEKKMSGKYIRDYNSGKKTDTTWNNKKISVKKYNNQFKKLFNMKEAKEFHSLKFVSKKKILKSL